MIIDLEIIGINSATLGYMIRDTIEHALLTLMPRRRKLITIDVEIAKDEDMGAALALVHQEEDDTFFMSLNESLLDDPEELVYTVAHECVHIKQYLRKEVKDLSVDKKKWKGEVYNLKEVNYCDLPWEQEAHLLQMFLANKVVKKWELAA